MKRKGVLFFLVLAMVMLIALPASAANVYVDGNQLNVATTSENGSTLIALRPIFQALGSEVTWDSATQTVTAVKGQTTIKLQIGSKTAYINGNSASLQVPGKVLNGNTMVPLRFVSESLGSKVSWDQATQTVTITSGEPITSIVPAPPVQIEPITPAVTTTGEYVGSKISDKYHTPGCRHAEKITVENKIWFKDANDAKTKGYIPCGVCL